MTCPKDSITLRRDLLNMLNTRPDISIHKMNLGHPKSMFKILAKLEDMGLIEVDTTKRTHKRKLTEKGKEYMKAYNDFFPFIDIC
jgi:predicted transcriptional regulator